jgi:Cys-tRNA(Pro) deacylase
MFHPSTQRVIEAAQVLGLDIVIITHEQSTRTAQEAADAVGCDVGQIVKSLCFTVSEAPVMVLVSGANQLDEKKMAAYFEVGRKKVQRAAVETVKLSTGYTIGGVAPFGHAVTMPILIDEDLLQFEQVWAAAGTPFSVFAISPAQLVKAINGIPLNIKKVAEASV